MKFRANIPLALTVAILVLAACGLAINLFLLIHYLRGGWIAGCGSGSGCEELLGSRWSQVLGIPVTGFGCLVYGVLMWSFTGRGGILLRPCLGLITGAAAWFVFVQAVLLGRFCPWCMSAHAIGILVTLCGLWRHALAGNFVASLKIIAVSAMAAVAGISLSQVTGPVPATHRVDEVRSAGDALDIALHARGSGRKVRFDDGRKTYDLSVLPHIGRDDATHVMVEYFDYSCAACRKMSAYLDALMAQHPTDICVVVLPVPMDRSCNHSLAPDESEHPDSCAMTRIALALWRANPKEFQNLHRVMFDGGSLTDLRAMALQSVSQADMDSAMRDPWIDDLIQANIRDWVEFAQGTRKLPKLLITGKRILHGLPTGKTDFIRVMERELGL